MLTGSISEATISSLGACLLLSRKAATQVVIARSDQRLKCRDKDILIQIGSSYVCSGVQRSSW